MTTSNVNSLTVVPQLETIPTLNTPNLEFLEETSGLDKTFLNLCVPIHKFALVGNWSAAKSIIDEHNKLKNAAITNDRLTLLHIAVGANHIEFVKQLMKMLDDRDLELQDIDGRTAFSFAAAYGNIEMVNLMLKRNEQLPIIRDRSGYTPILYAALQGKYKMTCHLYDKTIRCFEDEDRNALFFYCIYSGIYDLALKMVKKRNALAIERDEYEETALHHLARKQMPLDSSSSSEHDDDAIRMNPNIKEHMIMLVKFLWTTIIDKYYHSEGELRKMRDEPFPLTFEAAKVGNFWILREIISVYPSLIWEVNSKNQTIIHIAVLHRHDSIFRLVHEIGHQKHFITSIEDKEGNNIGHLAARLAPPSQLQSVNGAAFQMRAELIWFEEVKKIMMPRDINVRNREGFTAQEVFSKEHEQLREKGEQWMKTRAESFMLISTVIATGVFTAATSLPGGTNDDTGKPNYLSKTSFFVFAMSDALALVSSSIAILMFLSILVSSYRQYDFYKSLPQKLTFGFHALFISIASMMVAFSSDFFIIYYHGSKWVPSSIAILSLFPIIFYIHLYSSLFSDIFYSN